MAKNVIECQFSLLNEGRKYSGQHRKYVIENAKEICYAPETRERIKLREALGYYGHGRRVLCGKMQLQEVDVITLPDGQQAMISNIPSNVTLKFDVADDGTVKHSQEILDTETGKIVTGLNASRIGGFSWACPGKDGGATGTTRLDGFSGFDYVLQPGFAHNRGYVLESAQGQSILESVAAIVGDDKKAEQLVAGWRLHETRRLDDLENAVFESEAQIVSLREELENTRKGLADTITESANAKTELEQVTARFKGILENIAESLPFFIPDNVMHQMMEGDFSRARLIFENAALIDYSQYPLGRDKKRQPPATVPAPIIDKPDFGTADYGFDLKM